MEEFSPAQVPPPYPSSPVDANHPPSSRRLKRRLMFALVGLYGLSILAASVLLLRPRTEKGQKDKEGMGGLFAQKETVGWVTIRGAIYSSEGGRPWDRGVEQWVRRLRAMSETQGVKAIVLDINSPGGSVGAIQELHSQVLRIKKEKNIPIVALMGDVAASGGYYVAAACDKIVAHPGSITGSIGVIFPVQNLEGLFGKIGYKMDPIKSGEHKDIGSPARPMTAEERALLQSLIHEAYGQFLAAVAEGRKLPQGGGPWADGRIFTGSQAVKYNLVDILGDSTDAVELAGKLAGIAGTPKVRRDVDSTRWIIDIFEAGSSGGPGAGALSEALGLLSERLGLGPLGAVRPPFTGLEYRWAGF